MRYILPFLIFTILISCKKDSEFQYKFGNSLNMLINEEDQTIKPEPIDDDYITETLELDLDYDGVTDIRFSSGIDSLYAPAESVRWSIEMTLKNDLLSIYEIPNSNIRYETLGPKIYDYYGTYVRETRSLTYSCDERSGSSNSNTLPFPYTFNQGDIMDFESFNWGNLYSNMNLTYSSYEEDQYGFSETGDTLIRLALNSEASCYNPPSNQVFYLAYRLGNYASYRIGWIKAEITEGNRLTILNTAISNSTVN